MESKFKALLKKHWFAYMVATCTAVVLYWLLTHLFFLSSILSYLSPIIWGIFIAYIINPVVNFLENHLFKKMKKEKVKHIFSVILSLIIVIILLVLLGIAFIPSLESSVSAIAGNMDTYVNNVKTYIDTVSRFARRMNIDISNITGDADEFAQVIVNSITENSESILNSFSNVGTSIVNVGIGIILAVYFLFDKKKLAGGINRVRRLILSESVYERNNSFWKKCHAILIRFFAFDLLEGVIIGIINMIFMLMCRMPYVALISVIIALTNLIPTLGPIIGVSISAILLFLTNPISALIFIIFSIALQTVDASLLKPNLFGDGFGVPSVWIFIAIVLGGKTAGIIGVLFAVPVVAIITYSLNEIIFPSLEKRASKQKEDDSE